MKRVLIHATFLLGSLLLGSFVFALGVQTFRWLWDTTPEGGLSTIIDHWPWLVRLPAVFLTSLGGAALVVVGSATAIFGPVYALDPTGLANDMDDWERARERRIERDRRLEEAELVRAERTIREYDEAAR